MSVPSFNLIFNQNYHKKNSVLLWQDGYYSRTDTNRRAGTFRVYTVIKNWIEIAWIGIENALESIDFQIKVSITKSFLLSKGLYLGNMK